MSKKNSMPTLLLVGESNSGKTRLAHLLIGDGANDVDDNVDDAVSASTDENTNNNSSNNAKNDQNEELAKAKKILFMDTTRMAAPGGRGYRIVDAPPCELIMSADTDPRILDRLLTELEAMQRVNTIILVFRTEQCDMTQHHLDFINVCRSIFGLGIVNNVTIAFTDWPLDSASIESRRKAGVSQEEKTAQLSQILNKAYGTQIKHASFVMDAYEKLTTPNGGGDPEAGRRILVRDQELRRLLLTASHMEAFVPRSRDQVLADKKLVQGIVDGSLGDWNDARANIVDDLLRECEMSKDRYLLRHGRFIKSKIDLCDQILERECRTRNVTVEVMPRCPATERVEERLAIFTKLEEAKSRQGSLGNRWSHIHGALTEMFNYVDQHSTIDGLSSSQRESMAQTINLTRGTLEDLCAAALKFCEANNNQQ